MRRAARTEACGGRLRPVQTGPAAALWDPHTLPLRGRAWCKKELPRPRAQDTRGDSPGLRATVGGPWRAGPLGPSLGKGV